MSSSRLGPHQSEKGLPEEIRLGLQRFRTGSARRGTALFAVDAAAYLGLFLVLVVVDLPLAASVPLSLVLGLIITRLFIVGHDAAHGSLTGRPGLDGLLARLAFLPSLHPCSLWQVGHNRVHHSFTNLKGIDFIWTPFSPAEYLELPVWRRGAERFYRSVFGMGAYYMIEIWWNYLSYKGITAVGKAKRAYRLDVAMTLLFACAQAAVVYFFSARPGQTMLVAVVLPFLSWNWLMGFIIYNHHTHESVHFYENRREWRFFEGQVKGTVHVVFPSPFGWLLNQIMEHTAHHIDVRIPFYRLAQAQRFLEERMKDDLVIEHWTWRGFFTTLGRCQLYDYQNHTWITFREMAQPDSAGNERASSPGY